MSVWPLLGWAWGWGPGAEGAGLGLVRPCMPCRLPAAGASGQQSCLLHTVALSQSSMVCVLVGMEPQLWESRGPSHQALLTPTLGDFSLPSSYARGA